MCGVEMKKTFEDELKAEYEIRELCGFENIADTLLENYEIETLGDLVELDLAEVYEEDIKPLVKAFSKFDDGVLSKEDKEYLKDVDDNEEMLDYIKEMFESIQAEIYGEEEEEEADVEEEYEDEEEYSEEEYSEDEDEEETLTFKEELAESYDIGSATKLLGTNYILHLFIEDQESKKWTKKARIIY